MAVAVGTITISTGAVGTTFTVSGLAFQPDWILFYWSGRATAGSGEADHLFGSGMAISTTVRRAFTTQSDHSPTTMATDNMWRDDCCVATLSITGAIVGRADLDAMLSDGFRLIVDDQFPAALVVGYMCGTADEVAIVDFTDPAGTGDQSYNAGIDMEAGATDDKFVVIMGGVDNAVNTANTFSAWMCGIMAGNTAVGAVLAGCSQDAVGTAEANSHSQAGNCLAVTYSTAVDARATPAADPWTSTGFALNWTEVFAGGTIRFSALVAKGGFRAEVGEALTSTGTTNQAVGTTYEPKGLLILSRGNGENTADATAAHDTRIVGAATGPAARWCVAAQDKDNAGSADVWVDARTDAMYSNPSTAATQAVEGLMDLVSLDSTPGFTYVMDDADPSAAFFAFLVFADGDNNIEGTLARTLAALSVVSAGSVDIDGTLARTLAALSAASAGSVDIDGTLSHTLAAATLAAVGDVLGDIEGTLDEALAALLLDSDAITTIDGTLAKTLAAIILSSAGEAGDVIEGALSQTLAAILLDSDGSVNVDGTLVRTLAALLLDSDGTLSSEGTLDRTLVALLLDSNATVGDIVVAMHRRRKIRMMMHLMNYGSH